jgi:two-component system sensor histidine kinase YesM
LDKINGETVLVAHAFLEQVGWNIIYTVRMSELMAPYYRVINFYLVLSIILLTFLTLLIIRRSYGLSTPIIDLMNLMKKAAGGDFSIRAQVNKNNEIGQLCGIFNSMVHDIDVLIKQVYEAQTKQREAQLTSLQLQINPHFLYNTLQTIKWLADSYDARDIQQIVMSLADMFRYSISSEKYALLDEELNNIRDYIQIQHFRYGNRLSVDYDIEPGTEKIKIPKLFLQPLVENAILHGIDGKLGGGHIRVQVYRTDPWLHISVWDDGIGIEEEHLFFIRQYLAWNEKVKESKVPIGLKNLYDRGKLEFGENFSFSIESTFNEYTVVDLTIIPKT